MRIAHVALVTGGAAGIGRAIALRLARDGIAVGVLDLVEDAAAAVADEIAGFGGAAVALSGDIARRDTIAQAVERLRETLGPIAILVNNAGISDYVPFMDMTDAQWDRMMEVNLKGTFIVTQTVLPDMIDARW
ncbi:SDR family NAD(P)-dependent oxidoreductase [Novosphingobium sp. P6W]|uniref:SDR family NAD(P)-dependent oxidoreductase n=1 Tax=Novosphingobium sp. P6W TaxID=1609758 RepID=UPI000A52859A|nr:SDR family NAD(P)-dependent oxidoreductase [Novosphingobium sp. P6W]